MLNRYLQQVERFTRDQNQQLLHPHDLTEYVNRARREIALRTQSIRRTPPKSGSVQSITVTAGGSGYSDTPTVSISPPDSPNGKLPFPSGLQATARAIVIGGVIDSISVEQGGEGYFQPTVTISDSTGSGATATPVLSPIFQLNGFQEEYRFIDLPFGNYPGVGTAFAVQSIAVIYANYRYVLPMYPWTIYQAMIRQYPLQYFYVPTMASQYGVGADGSLFMYPIPSQPYQCELDCYCLPSDLSADEDPEALPQPWQDAVPYFAAHLAYAELQNANMAMMYLKLYDEMVHRYSQYANITRTINPYGRY